MGSRLEHRASRRAVLIGAAACLAAPAVRAAPLPFRIGLTPVFLDSDLRLTGQIETYLASALARPVALVKRRTYMEITSLLVAGHLDAAWICGLPFVQPQLQAEYLRLVTDCRRIAPLGVAFTWEFDATKALHARHLVTDTGWKILLDRGLDVFQRVELNNGFNPAGRHQRFRPVRAFEVTYLRQTV